MFKRKTIQEQLTEERNKSKALTAQLIKTRADLEYISMMTDIDIDEEEEEDAEEQV